MIREFTLQQFLFKKKLSLVCLSLLAVTGTFAQNGVAINTTGNPANKYAMLDITSTSGGLLIPRMTAAQRILIPVSATTDGLLVYQTDAPSGFYYYNFTLATWILLSTSSGTVTSVTASSPLSSSGGITPNITLSGIVPVANGGTGVAAAPAFSFFGNAGITSAAPSFNTATADGQFLVRRSTGLTFGTIQATDIPSLANSYIQNQFSSAQAGAGFWSNGAGKVEGAFTSNGLLTSNAGQTNTGALTSSGGAINLNSPLTGTNAFATNINTGTNTGQVTIGGTGPQTINVGNNFSTGTNTVNIGTNADGPASVNIFGGQGGVNINTVSNRTTTIGSNLSPTILIGASATGGIVSLGSASTTTNLNGSITAINGSPVNINIGNNKATNINTLATSGAVNIGATAAAIQAIGIGTGVTGTSTIIIGNSSSDAVTTSINGGVASGTTPGAGVNINVGTGKASATNIGTGNTTGAVTIGNSSNNLFFPKFTLSGTGNILYTNAGTVSGTTTASDGTVLTLSGGIPAWSSSIPSGSGNYIQNQAASAQAANYYISGPASIGTANVSTQLLTVANNTAANIGIVGQNSASLGASTGIGIQGSTAQSLGYGVYGINSNAAGYAVRGQNTAGSSTSTGIGVLGLTSQSAGFGLAGANFNSNGTGIIGGGNNSGIIYYLTAGSGGAFTGTTTGIFAKNTSNGVGESIYTENGNGSGLVTCVINYYSGLTQYKILGTGTVSTTAYNIDNKSKVVLHAPEAPEILFEDYGQGQLINGKVHINIDPIFSKNVTINDKHPLRVFIQLEGDCNGVFVTNKSTTGFDVVELQKGSSNVSFQWHIVCNRADENIGDGKISKNTEMRFEAAPTVVPQLQLNQRILNHN